ncbi:MAG TPA: hypothetical protein VH596_00285 [Terriglobales bacterium]|jgi:hypothetical protein
MRRPYTSGSEIALVGQLAAAVSLASFFYYLRHGDLLSYGDAVAHINIARRLFDSRTPGLLQLGTVWLPLPHLLMLPFLIPRWMWQTGIGGSIPSLFSFVLSVIGVFRLLETVLVSDRSPVSATTRFPAWLAAGIFALNPNLGYLQTTAMTEPIYLAFFIWAVVFFAEAIKASGNERHAGQRPLLWSGLCVLGACLTRYDGWLLAAVMIVLVLVLASRSRFVNLRSSTAKFVLIAAVGPIFWIGYNAAVYHNPLEFANGPYSAKAIEQKTAMPGTPPHPGTNDLPVAFQYFFKAAQLNLATGKWQIFWVCSLLLGAAIVVLFQRKLWPMLLLWTPVPFYMLSVAYSGVPIFIPPWWPFSRYNARYGIEMLPAFAVFASIAAYGLMRFAASKRARLIVGIVFVLLAVGSYVQVWREGPVSFEEAVVNSRTRIALEKVLANNFEMLPPESTFLMYLGDHVGAFQRAGIPLSQVINEGNHRSWKRPTDPEGLWERALKDPAAYVNFVVAFDSDVVATKVNKSELQALVVLRVTGQPETTIYTTIRSNHPR